MASQSILEAFGEQMAVQVVGKLGEAGQARLAALHAANSAMSNADVYDRVRLARYILTGSETQSSPPDVEDVKNLAGETVIRLEKRAQTEDYPFTSGDVLVLGPQIFASTPAPTQHTVINWQGINFVPQDPGFFAAQERERAKTEVVGPDPAFGPADEEEDDEVNRDREPAPSAGTRWAGRRGRQPD